MHLGAWPGGSWLPWRAAPLLLCSCSCLVFERLPQEWSYLSFHLLTCTMGFAPIKWTCTAFFRPRQLTDRAILANRQTQEKKMCLHPSHRWKSDDTIAWLRKRGLHSVPDSIKAEIGDLVCNGPKLKDDFCFYLAPWAFCIFHWQPGLQ